jgi:hypothetical protein
MPRDLIESPMSGRRCVYYQYTVEEWQPSRIMLSGDGCWQLREHDEAIAEFYLQDGDTRAVIAPHNALVERGRGVMPARVDIGDDRRRAHELCICAGDRVEVQAIVDHVEDLYDEGRHYRTRATLLLLRAPPGEPLRIRLLP